ncbi:MAG: AAA family ATPase [Chloroflexi bacterium]|nr:AAA family ATPase [Chloroflexota bacterium]
MTATHDVLQGLNDAQRRAVEVPGGALLILAGPGSGKTRVIAHRIAYLVRERDVAPWRVLAVTFTNKAANEMRERVEDLLGTDGLDVMMGTFHSFCARVLRRDGEAIGVPSDYAIYATDDQLAVVREAMETLNVDPKRWTPRAVLSAISRAKNERRDASATLRDAGSYFEEIVGRVFERYQAVLREYGALDFDDLLGEALRLFEEHPDVRERHGDRYRHILIDEFQDTNLTQYQLAGLLAEVHGNITAVGDPDQSIYSWRAADLRNLLHFERDFPDAQVILLEQNYRSTGRILRSAHSLISGAKDRRERSLWTNNPDGEPVVVEELFDADEEGHFVALEIGRLMGERRREFADFAVMYRTNAQSRAFEEACIQQGIRYRIVGGTRFYDRREVRDLLAYLRLIRNHADGVAFRRIVNVPGRGIGDRTLERLREASEQLELPLLAVAARIARGDEDPALPQLRGDIRLALRDFVALVDRLTDAAEEQTVATLLETVLAETRYHQYLERNDEDHAEVRWENVQELVNVASQYQDLEPTASLASFLEEVALVADVDDPGAEAPDAVTLTTLHAAKGLEFPVVFMPGMEEGLLPHSLSMDDPAQMEEERRVCYVGMTRARERLYLTHARRRMRQGRYSGAIASRFLDDLPIEDTARARTTRGTRPAETARERRAAYAARQAEGWGDDDAAGDEEPRYSPGDRVRHATFGVGVVVSCEVERGDQRVTVAFEGQGVKKLLLSIAPLEPAE